MTTKTKTRIGRFNSQMTLIGEKFVVKPAEGDIEIGDLPADGTYKYNAELKTFVPLGHGFGKVKTREPYEPTLVMATLIDTLEKAGIELPPLCIEWRDWYNVELRRRHEELSSRPR